MSHPYDKQRDDYLATKLCPQLWDKLLKAGIGLGTEHRGIVIDALQKAWDEGYSEGCEQWY